jgi:hypothetical protein
MPTKYARSEDFRTPECRLSFAQHLFKPREDSKKGTKQYQGTLIFPKTADRSALEGAVRHCIVETWGERGLERARTGLVRSPFLDGAGKEARSKETGELHEGMGPDVFFLRVAANEQYPPVLRYRSPNIPATPEEIYSGCYGFAVLNAYAWHNAENGDGVSFGIKYFQKLRDGERLGGSAGVDPEKWHEKIADEGAAPATTQGGAGAAGLFGGGASAPNTPQQGLTGSGGLFG